jgi:poly(3-hydroxybutyrate) depolymerase
VSSRMSILLRILSSVPVVIAATVLLMFSLAPTASAGAGGDLQVAASDGRASVAVAAGGEGRVDKREYRTSKGVNEYLVYTPRDWNMSDRLPVYIAVHGCGLTAEQFMDGTLLNRAADRERFIVVYPDNGGQCWRAVFNDPASTTRGGGGDADIIAGMTKETSKAYGVDSERVYLIGGSSGAFQASAMGAAYPDLYAAIGILAGGPYGSDFLTCMTVSELLPPAIYALQTVHQMGSRARVVPVLTIGGTSDPLGEQQEPSGCSRLAYRSWLAANNLVKPGRTGDTFQDDPDSVRNGQVAGGYEWTVRVARDQRGCQIAERWIVHGMGHTWPGGTSEPKAPDGADLSWRFFKKFTLSGGNTSCR